ncbi:MAG: YdcF family protein [Kiritimatiellae bacterium]|nr:YdcF family protein [Kiritimatiellia bacterium]
MTFVLSVFAIAIALLAAFLVVMDWIALFESVRTKRFRSPVPFLGGAFGVIACLFGGWFCGLPALLRLFWIPLLLDPTWPLFVLALPRMVFPHGRWRRRLARLVLAGVAFVLACNLAVLIAAAGRVTPAGHAAEAPARRAAVVMGCIPKLRGGWDNPYFTARIEAAAELWRAGKVEALIVSGDNHVAGYDEPSDMKAALVAAGVPEDRIVCDYAGFRTLDSVVRAKTIFGLDSFLVVSQDFHVRRAIFLGRCKGLDVRGYAAPLRVARRARARLALREPLARVVAVLDVLFGRRPRFGGPPVPLPCEETR